MTLEFNFVCPKCGKKAHIIEEQICKVSTKIESFKPDSWRENKNGIVIEVCDYVHPNCDEPEIMFSDDNPITWVCSECESIINEKITDRRQLVNYLLLIAELAEE